MNQTIASRRFTAKMTEVDSTTAKFVAEPGEFHNWENEVVIPRAHWDEFGRPDYLTVVISASEIVRVSQ